MVSLPCSLGTASSARRANRRKRGTPRGRRATRAELGHARKRSHYAPKVLRSFRLDDARTRTDVQRWRRGERRSVRGRRSVKVTGTSKGGQGIVKRHKAAAVEHARQHEASPSSPLDRVPIRLASSRARRCPAVRQRAPHADTPSTEIDAGTRIYIRGSVAGPTVGSCSSASRTEARHMAGGTRSSRGVRRRDRAERGVCRNGVRRHRTCRCTRR